MRNSIMKSVLEDRAGRAVLLEVGGVDAVHLVKVARVPQPHLDVDDVGERAAGGRTRAIHRLEGPVDLVGEGRASYAGPPVDEQPSLS